MGLFNNRNANESAYVGGKKHWADVIKNSGDGNLLIWRQPEEDFNTNSTLIVMPGEEAIFIKGGTIEQVFTNGTYKLSTENYPFISRLRNAFTGGISTFNCVVYFVRSADSREIEWGTMSPIQYMCPGIGNLQVKAYGAYKIRITNPSVFLTKMIGNNVDVETQEGLVSYFANQFQMHIVNSLSKTLDRLTEEGKNVFTTVRNTVELAASVEPHLSDITEDYGISIVNFSVGNCKLEASDPTIQKRMDEAMFMQGQFGNTWMTQRQMEIMQDVANNPGMAGMGSGLGMGMGAGIAFGNMSQMMFGQPIQQPNQPAPAPGPSPTSAAPAGNPVMEKLKQAKELLDMGLISQEEFDAKKKELLSQL